MSAIELFIFAAGTLVSLLWLSLWWCDCVDREPVSVRMRDLAIAFLVLALALSGCAPKLRPGPVTVARVVDGDTVWVRQDGRRSLGEVGGPDHVFKLRLVGIDTPEQGRFEGGAWRFDPECHALAATRRLRAILETCAPVVRVSEKGRDRFGRWLAALECEGESVALTLIREGHGREYTWRGEDYPGRAAHIKAEQAARAAGRGGWGACENFGNRRASHRSVEQDAHDSDPAHPVHPVESEEVDAAK